MPAGRPRITSGTRAFEPTDLWFALPQESQKTCTECGETKSIGEFRFCKPLGENGYVEGRCKKCARHRDQVWRDRNREKVKRQERERYRIAIVADPEMHKREYAKNRGSRRADVRKYHKTLREKVFDLLGRKCSRCGYDADTRALQIDHINGGGSQERKRLHKEGVMNKILACNGVGYQILCANCNWIKRIEKREDKQRGSICQV